MATPTDGVPYKGVKILESVPGASGPLRALLYLLAVPLVWGALLAILAREFLRSPLGFFRRTPRPRRAEDLCLPPSLSGLVHEWLDVGGGVRLHAASFGRQPGKPLMLFLHGFPECWYSWHTQMSQFRSEYEVVALDMRGYGWSDKPQSLSAYTLGRLTADVAGAVAALGRSSCTLVAHDWGGVVAWAAAGRYPGLVDRLVVAAAPHLLLYKRNMTLKQVAASSYIIMFQMPFFSELLLTHTDGALFDDMWRPVPAAPTSAPVETAAAAAGNGTGAARTAPAAAAAATGAAGGGQRQSRRRQPPPHPAAPRRYGAFTDSDVAVYKAAMLSQPGAPTAALNYYRALLAADAGLLPFDAEVDRGLRRELEMPVLVVWGADDHALLVFNLIGVAEVAPRSEIHILPNCSHWIQEDQPEELSRVMRDWLAAHPLTA